MEWKPLLGGGRALGIPYGMLHMLGDKEKHTGVCEILYGMLHMLGDKENCTGVCEIPYVMLNMLGDKE